jgi:hypothetical protein
MITGILLVIILCLAAMLRQATTRIQADSFLIKLQNEKIKQLMRSINEDNS